MAPTNNAAAAQHLNGEEEDAQANPALPHRLVQRRKKPAPPEAYTYSNEWVVKNHPEWLEGERMLMALCEISGAELGRMLKKERTIIAAAKNRALNDRAVAKGTSYQMEQDDFAEDMVNWLRGGHEKRRLEAFFRNFSVAGYGAGPFSAGPSSAGPSSAGPSSANAKQVSSNNRAATSKGTSSRSQRAPVYVINADGSRTELTIEQIMERELTIYNNQHDDEGNFIFEDE